VIGVIENHAPTRHLRIQVPVRDGQVHADPANDVAKIAVIERHRATGNIMVGLVSGFGFMGRCAIGSTVAHDSHQLMVVGTDDEDMAMAANTLAQCGGGQVAVKDGEVIALVELNIGGLMSTEHVDIVARKADLVLKAFRQCGCGLNNPNMQLSLLGLVVIPELRISDKGLVDVSKFDFVPVLEK
jgi:adenine deaminase